jgi:hypothetical protein
MTSRLMIGLLLTLASVDVASARQMTEKERMRAQAEHLCYNDVQKLCNADIPDETKIAACMKAHHAQLSPGCRKVFDTGLK